ncbi:MAG: hypothetical protein F6J86_30040 [Symploca sp. SIO1B1]|nr:hypothetical protein [Symploca sp. SIO1B1]
MIKDSIQKDMLCRHFAAQNYYVQPEVPVFHRGGIHERKKLITDIDVLALRPSPDLRWELVLADCKTLKGQSPANRVLWLRGLMDQFSASSGVIMLQRKQTIESDHKLFAASLKIHLIDEEEFDRFDKAIIYPSGSSQYPLSAQPINELKNLYARYKPLRYFCEYIYGFVWSENSRFELLRKVIGEALTISKEIDPEKPEHLALILDAAGVFAVGLAECVGTIFNQYLQPETSNQLDQALKVVIWGGRDQYDFFAKLRHEVALAQGRQPGPEGSLALPFWDGFLQLVRHMLENPRLSFSLPQLLRKAALDVYYNSNFLANNGQQDLLLIKYAMSTCNYFCKAAKFPAQTKDVLEKKFIKKQSDLVHYSDHERRLLLVDSVENSENKIKSKDSEITF